MGSSKLSKQIQVEKGKSARGGTFNRAIKVGHIEKGKLEVGEGSAMAVRDLKGRHTPRVFQELQTGPCARRTRWRRVVIE